MIENNGVHFRKPYIGREEEEDYNREKIMDGLLTDKKIFKIVFGKEPIDKEWEETCLPLYKDQICQAQATKSHQATLKEVGKWLEKKRLGQSFYMSDTAEYDTTALELKKKDFEALKRGEFPQ